jgi:flagellar biosynthesis protein FlhG
MADLSTYEMHLIAHGVRLLEGDYDYMLVDSAAGVSLQNLSFAEACDLSLVVTTPDLTAMTDAYALLKVLYARNPEAQMLLVVNRCEDEEEAVNVERRIADVCERFLGRVPRFVGWIPSDPVVARAVNHRCSVVSEEPNCRAARAFRILAVRLLEELNNCHAQGLGRTLLDNNGYTEDAI